MTDLDAAWHEAEAALPDGWRITALYRHLNYNPDPVWTAEARGNVSRCGYGPTPAGALRSLAAAIRAIDE